jgi:DNA-binding NarL/FixJ family response regulator
MLKDVALEQLLAGIRIIAQGESLLSPSVTGRLIESSIRDHPPTPQPGLDRLTAREPEILRLLARGLSNAETADQLVVSSTTVKTHVARVLVKLWLRDRVQAVAPAYEAASSVPAPRAEPIQRRTGRSVLDSPSSAEKRSSVQ